MTTFKRWRIRLAHWILPELFRAVNDMGNNAVPLTCAEIDDKYHVRLIDEPLYTDAWIRAMTIVHGFGDGWKENNNDNS